MLTPLLRSRTKNMNENIVYFNFKQNMLANDNEMGFSTQATYFLDSFDKNLPTKKNGETERMKREKQSEVMRCKVIAQAAMFEMSLKFRHFFFLWKFILPYRKLITWKWRRSNWERGRRRWRAHVVLTSAWNIIFLTFILVVVLIWRFVYSRIVRWGWTAHALVLTSHARIALRHTYR